MLNISEKDKRFLYFICCLAIFFSLIWFLLRPAISALSNSRDDYNQANSTMEDTDMKISLIPSQKANIQSLTSQLEEASADFYPMLASFDIDELLTSLAISYGLTSKALNITMPVDYTKSSPYQYSEKYGGSGSTSTRPVLSGVYSVPVTMTLSGSRTQLQSFIDTISSYKAMQLYSFTWDQQYTSDADYELSISLLIYMTDN